MPDIGNPAVLQAIYDNVNKAFTDKLQETKPMLGELYDTVPSTSEAEVYGWLEFIPGFTEMFRGQPRVFRNVKSTSYRVPNRKFENTIPIELDDISDSKLGQYAIAGKMIGATGALLPDQLIAELIRLSASTALCYDGYAIASASHKVGITSFDNTYTKTLTATSLEYAINTMLGWVFKADKLSEPRPLNIGTAKLLLWHPPALRSTARKLCLMPFDAFGASNSLFEQAIPITIPTISAAAGGSDTAWGLVNVGGPIKPFFIQNRLKLEMMQKTPANSDKAFTEDKFIIGAKCRMAALPTFPWLFWRSTGAST